MLEQTDAVTNEVLEPITFVLAYPTVLLVCDSEEIIKQNWRYIHKHSYDMAKQFASNILKRLLFCEANIVL
jgi:hypothetical protein